MKYFDLELGISSSLALLSMVLCVGSQNPDVKTLAGLSSVAFIGGSIGYIAGKNVGDSVQYEELKKNSITINNLNHQINSKDTVINRLESELECKRLAYRDLSEACQVLEAESLATIDALAKKNSVEVSELRAVINEYHSEMTILRKEIDDKSSEVLQLHDVLSQAESTIERLELTNQQTIRKAKDYLQEVYEQRDKDLAEYKESVSEAMESDFKARSERFKNYRSKLIDKVNEERQKFSELKTQFDNLLKSQLETVSLLEEHIKTSERWKDSASTDFEKQMNTYEAKLKEYQLRLASVPVSELFNGSDRASHNGNKLISLFQQKGLILHASKCDTGKTRDVIWLRPSNCVLSQVEEHSELIHQVFELIKQPIITLDKGLIKIELHTNEVEIDVSQYVKHFTELETLVSKSERIKIDGGSESGKSPLADNIIGIKKAQSSCKILLSNPLHGSKKDYWKLPATYKSYGEARNGLLEFVAELHKRSTQARTSKELGMSFPNFPFELYVFDEIDITLQDGDSKKALKEILKTASHYNLGIIFIGQSPYCSEAGMKQADFLNCCQIHIGNVAQKAIELSSHPSTLKTKLLDEFNKINRFYADKNRTVKDERHRYRFALVDDGRTEPYFLELPPIGFYTYDIAAESAEIVAEIVDDNADRLAEVIPISAASNNVIELDTANHQHNDDNFPMCPSCKSANVKKHSARGRGKYQFQCLNQECSKKFFTLNLSEEIAKAS